MQFTEFLTILLTRSRGVYYFGDLLLPHLDHLEITHQTYLSSEYILCTWWVSIVIWVEQVGQVRVGDWLEQVGHANRLVSHSALASKLLFLAVQGLGALLSSNLEEALYKSPQ